MRRILYIIILFLISCSTTKIVNSYQSYEQLDSIFKVEKILTYDSLPLQDYETKEWFYEYYFIRDSLVIRWIPRGDSIQITKRIDK